MAKDGLVIDTSMHTCVSCATYHELDYAGIGLHFTFIRISIVNAAFIYLI